MRHAPRPFSTMPPPPTIKNPKLFVASKRCMQHSFGRKYKDCLYTNFKTERPLHSFLSCGNSRNLNPGTLAGTRYQINIDAIPSTTPKFLF